MQLCLLLVIPVAATTSCWSKSTSQTSYALALPLHRHTPRMHWGLLGS
jgi:hypothetical protein